jgi:hypothetical protein
MIWLLTRVVVWPVKVGAGSAKLGYKTGRLLGYRRIFVFGLGVAVGLLVAPTTGAVLRDRIRALLDADMTNDPVPAEAPSGRDHVVDLTTTEGAR